MRLAAALATLSLACTNVTPDSLPAAPAPSIAAPTTKWVYDVERLGLPAYQLPSEKSAQKGDTSMAQGEVVRYESPQWYAVTEPPKGKKWRHMNEWEPMQSMLLNYNGAWNAEITQFFVDIIVATVPVAEAWVVYAQDSKKSGLETQLTKAGVDLAKVKWFKIPSDAVWLIDFGPMPLIDTEKNNVSFLDWRYYPTRPYDDAIPTQLGQMLGVTTYREPLDEEGGNFQGDGAGHCYTSQRELYYTGLTEAKLLATFKEYAACEQLHVMKDLDDDGTGHIDMFFKLGKADLALMGQVPEGMEAPPGVENAQSQTTGKDVPMATQIKQDRERLDWNAEFLAGITVANGNKITVKRIPMPGFGYDKQFKGWTNTPFTYINSTLVNGRNLWPAFSFPEWAESRAAAEAAWKDAMPEYEHIPITADEITLASGAVHCITRTIPDLPFEKWVPDGTCTDKKCVPPVEAADIGMTEACETSDLCFGPAWLCTCNDCATGCKAPEPVVDNCNGVTYEGCCDGDNLSYCQDGALTTGGCKAGTCGWNGSAGYYDCNTDGTEDPTGANPRACGGACTPACDGKQCGDDGCGGSCGDCGEGAACTAGKCGSCKTCTEGDLGCDGDVPWTCEAAAGGCTEKKPGKACAEGFMCETGKCWPKEAPSEDTGSGAPVEADAATSADLGVTGGGDAGTTGGGNKGGGGGSSSCASAAGGTHAPVAGGLLLLALGALVALRRRRA